MEVTYCPTYSDILRCTLYSLKSRRDLWLRLAILALIGAFTSMHQFAHLGWLSFPLAVFVQALIMAAVMGVVLHVLLLWRLMKPTAQRQCTTKLTAEAFADIYHRKTKAFLWTAISEVCYDQGDIHVLRRGKDDKFVPRSAFNNRQQSLAFYEESVRLWNAAKDVQFSSPPQDSTVWPPAPQTGV